MVFHFEHVSLDHGAGKFSPRPLDLRELKATLGRWQAGIGIGWNSLYWSNHDQPRVVSRFGDADEHWARSATMLATVLHLHRGTPFVYQGEELGMTNAPLRAIEDYRDIESLNHYAAATQAGEPPDRVLDALGAMGRDHARTPMQWDAVDARPVSPPARRGWRSTRTTRGSTPPPSTTTRTSVFNHYRRLIELRHSDAVVVDGDFTMLAPEDPFVYAFTRRLDDRAAARGRQLHRRAAAGRHRPRLARRLAGARQLRRRTGRG